MGPSADILLWIAFALFPGIQLAGILIAECALRFSCALRRSRSDVVPEIAVCASTAVVTLAMGFPFWQAIGVTLIACALYAILVVLWNQVHVIRWRYALPPLLSEGQSLIASASGAGWLDQYESWTLRLTDAVRRALPPECVVSLIEDLGPPREAELLISRHGVPDDIQHKCQRIDVAIRRLETAIELHLRD